MTPDAKPEAVTDRFDGHISVSSTIVDYLSSGLYRTPAACLKELINNSYDADATRVDIFVRPDANRIIVADNGTGMSRDTFKRHFERISESHKREGGETTELGRPKIGKIGIGFIAANELCEELELFSTMRGSTELLYVKVDFTAMRLPVDERRTGDGNVTKADYVGEMRVADSDSHYTEIYLNQVKGPVRDILAGATSQSGTRKDGSLYGLTELEVRDLLCSGTRAWSDFDSYSETQLRVGLYTPVQHHEQWMPEPELSTIASPFRPIGGFEVKYDSTEVRAPIVLCPGSKAYFVRPFAYSGKQVSATGYFYVQHGTIWPQDLIGLLIRIRGVAVGDYDPTFLDFPTSLGPLFQRWISAELYASDGLEEAMNIDRRTLRSTHPAFVELRQAVHAEMPAILRVARSQLFGAGADDRRRSAVASSLGGVRETVEEYVRPVNSQVASNVIAEWESASKTVGGARDLSRQYDVGQLYYIVLETAKNVLPPDLFVRFVEALTNRLRKQ